MVEFTGRKDLNIAVSYKKYLVSLTSRFAGVDDL